MSRKQKTFEEILEVLVDKDGPLPDQTKPHYVGLGVCWSWLGAKTGEGYGAVTFTGRQHRAHRLFYTRFHAKTIPDKMCVCHRCDNPSCVNPEHLFVGSHKNNAEDRVAKGRSNTASGDRNGARTMPWRHARHGLGGASGLKNGAHTHPEKVLKGAAHAFAKIDEACHAKIFELRSHGLTQKRIGELVGMTQSNISQILSGVTWKHKLSPSMTAAVGGIRLRAKGESIAKSKLDSHKVSEIRKLSRDGLSWSKIALLYGVSKFTVGCVVNRKTWKHVE